MLYLPIALLHAVILNAGVNVVMEMRKTVISILLVLTLTSPMQHAVSNPLAPTLSHASMSLIKRL
jgi:hypothetical protein